ncbi:porin family protein [Ancylobacter dichloromethanicus]|uniref:Membrane protein n=1 Tax=Ancylobacter dichloromethanicus TaxID=518825 RepID=A0A9W6MYF6_9HYPH|nr:outer membrane protein [Ancylobacter dichloromethanicus]MBS7553794.1 porin family protein [Ancylobacter dichloromethanicus]GLK70900.1 membrane protein [Ancylobacter dichloromethanicus]
MKKIICSGVAAVALLAAAPAFAADIAQPYPTKAPPMVVEPVFTWTGFYLGANAGYAWGSGESGAEIIGLDPSGFLGGGQIGVNYQFDNNVVLGAEADFQGSDIKDSYAGYESKMDYFGTVRARLGYAFGNVLPYVTGGLAWGHTELKDNYLGLSSDKTAVGWTVGGGVEYAFTNNWTVKAEYLYMDLGEDYYDSIGYKSGLTANVVRAGVNYKF